MGMHETRVGTSTARFRSIEGMDDRAAPPPPEDRRGAPRRPGIPLGLVLGVPVFLHVSWLVLAVFVTLAYGQIVQARTDLSPPAAYLVGFGFVVCLVFSVLLHELGHALTARRYGIGVRGITLELLGGYTEMDGDAPRPRVELVVSLAGPAVSLLLGVLAAVATAVLSTDTLVGLIMFQVAAANILVAAFNSLPGLPLDGGRALRAVVWALRGDRHLGTLVAGWSGRVVAAVTLSGAALLYAAQALTLFGLVFMLIVAFTLWQGASASIRLARISARFPLIDVSRLARPVFAVPTGTPLAEAQRRAEEAGREAGALGVADSTGRLVALVHPEAAAAVPVERRPWIPVDSVAHTVSDMSSIPVEMRGEAVVRVVQQNPGTEYLVTSGDDVVGVLRLTDLAHLLEPKGTRTQ
jgi:Zn-dependent protease